MPQTTVFADARAGYNESLFVIFGVPFDRTSSFRMGSRFAPNRIREESYNFESYMFEHGIDLSEIPIHDAGNLEEFGNASQMVEGVEFAASEIALKKGKFMIMLGGEHSITGPAVKAHKKFLPGGDMALLQLDAHLDFRASYLDEPNSHACALRRGSDSVGIKKAASIGIRSMSAEEAEEIQGTGLTYVNAYEVHEKGIAAALKKATAGFGKSPIYLTLDIDVLDPAYAPGTGTPEPFGLTPLHLKEIIDVLSHRLVAFDLVEVCPPYDNGNTSALAARLVREVIATVWKSQYKDPHKKKKGSQC